MVICKHIMKDHLNRRLKVIRRMPHSQNPGSQWVMELLILLDLIKSLRIGSSFKISIVKVAH